MNPWLFLKSEWASSRGGILALALILALAVSLGVGVSLGERALRQGMIRAGDDFSLLVGAPGGSVPLALGAVYLRPESLPLLPARHLFDLQNNPGVVWAAPLAFGDRFGNAPIVGSSVAVLTLGGKRPLAQGRVFAARNEAVAGAAVPLGLNQTFSPQHGLVAVPDDEAPQAHANGRFTVVGRLPATGTPWDRAIIVPIEAVWASHDLLPAQEDAGHDTQENHDHEELALLPQKAFADPALPGVSAIVVQPRSVADAYKLRGAWNNAASQAVFTGEVLVSLFATLGDVRGAMQAMAVGAQVVALAAAVLAAIFAVALRRRTLALMRALGAPRLYLLGGVWLLTALTLFLGATGGLALGRILASTLAAVVRAQAGLSLNVALQWPEYALVLAFFLVGSLCALVPAALVWRKAPGSR